MSAVIFDLDGCLSDDRWRRRLLPAHRSVVSHSGEYDAYNNLCGYDAVENKHIFDAATAAHDRLLFVTARPERHRGATTTWIEERLGAVDYTLIMRHDHCLLPSAEVKIKMLAEYCVLPSDVAVAYDDRHDVLDAYREWGISDCRHLAVPAAQTAADILQGMADTFRERNAAYGDNWRQVAQLVKVFFPSGVPPELVVTDHWHLFELKLVKLSRFAISGLQHIDSIHDDAVYSAMIEAALREQKRD